jgi:hypothetical protein
VRFVIDWTPPSLNVALRQHWSERRKSLQVAGAYILAAIGRPEQPERGRVRVTIEMYRKQAMDQDGAYGAAKPLFDALVRTGWARDDSNRWMAQEVRSLVDRRHPRTEIELMKEV